MMSKESKMPFPLSPKCHQNQGLFNIVMGILHRQLQLEEYSLLKFSPTFESDFVQVSKKGGIIDVHNQVQLVRVAIAITKPALQIPNVLLLARPVMPPRSLSRIQHPPRIKFELTRLLPLCFVKISIHNLEKKQLRFKLVTGRTFYLQLCPLQDTVDNIFEIWVKIVHLLRPPSKTKLEVPEQEVPREAEDRTVESTDSVAEEDLKEKSTEETKENEESAEETKENEGSTEETKENEESTEGTKENEGLAEPSQVQQNIREDSSSSILPRSQDETTEEETIPRLVNQRSEEQLEETSEGSKEWTPKTTTPASRKKINRSKFHRVYSSQKANSRRKLSTLFRSFSSTSLLSKKAKSKGKEP